MIAFLQIYPKEHTVIKNLYSNKNHTRQIVKTFINYKNQAAATVNTTAAKKNQEQFI